MDGLGIVLYFVIVGMFAIWTGLWVWAICDSVVRRFRRKPPLTGADASLGMGLNSRRLARPEHATRVVANHRLELTDREEFASRRLRK